MAGLALQFAAFAITILACVYVLRAFPRFRVLGRRPRGDVLALAISLVPAGPIVISASTYDIGTELPAALILATTLLLAAVGIAMLYVAWRADPARGRVRCPRCWYDLTGAQSPICPECGRQSTPRQRARTRRSPRLALVGAASLLLSLAGLKAPQVQQHGWQALIPTTALILSLEHIPSWLLENPTPPGAFPAGLGFTLPGMAPPAPAPAPTDWDLRARIPTMWPWQRQLLQWRVHRIFRASRDFNHIERARRFIDAARPPRLGDESAARYVELVLEGDNPVRAQPQLDAYMPQLPSADAQRRIADAIIDALRTADAQWAVRATKFIHLAPNHAAPLADALVARLKRTEISFVFAGVPRLALLARHDEHAWTLLTEMLAHPDPHLRYYATGTLAHLPERRAEAIDAALVLLADNNEDVSRNALASLSALAPDLCVHAAPVWAAGLRGPNIGQDVLSAMKDRACDTPDYRAAVRATLASDDPQHLTMALRALVLMSSIDAPTAEAVRELANSTRSQDAAGELAAVFSRFSIAAEPTGSTEP